MDRGTSEIVDAISPFAPNVDLPVWAGNFSDDVHRTRKGARPKSRHSLNRIGGQSRSFVSGRQAFLHQAPGFVGQGAHAVRDAISTQDGRAGAGAHEIAPRVRHGHPLEDAGPATAALAGRIEPADQALGQHALDGRGHEVGLDAEVDQACDGPAGVVGVQSGEHEVARQGGLDGDPGGLGVADFADHDHVGVLPQHCAQGRTESETGRGVCGHLHHAIDFILHRVLDRDDADVGLVEPAQRGVKGRGLAGAGRTGHEHQAMRADAMAKRIIEEIIAPKFRQGNFAGGVVAGVESILNAIDGEPLPPPHFRPGGNSVGGMSAVLENIVPILIGLVVFGKVLQSMFGRLIGATVMSTVAGFVGWLFFSSLIVALFISLLIFFLSLFSNTGGGIYRGGRGDWSGGNFGGGGWFRRGGWRFWWWWRIGEMVSEL